MDMEEHKPISNPFDLQQAMKYGLFASAKHCNVYCKILHERVTQLESLLLDARRRLDAPYCCEGQLCGPDGKLAAQIDKTLKEAQYD